MAQNVMTVVENKYSQHVCVVRVIRHHISYYCHDSEEVNHIQQVFRFLWDFLSVLEFYFILFYFIFKCLFIFERERESTRRGGAEREGDRGSKAGSVRIA